MRAMITVLALGIIALVVPGAICMVAAIALAAVLVWLASNAVRARHEKVRREARRAGIDGVITPRDEGRAERLATTVGVVTLVLFLVSPATALVTVPVAIGLWLAD